MKKVSLLIVLLISAGMISVSAQTKKVVADKIVGQVGDKIILRSDVLNTISDLKRQSQGQDNVVLPTECQVLESQLIRKALLLQAQKDSLTVSEEDVDAELDNRIRSAIMQYGSKDVLEEIAGKTVYQIKEDAREGLREQKLADQMQNKIVESIKITPTEVKAFYGRTSKDSLPYYESELEISQIVLHPKANKDVEDYVSKQMYDYKRQIESGSQKMEQLAKLYSEDPAVKENAGMYTLNRNDKGSWDPTFLSTAFRLKEGQVSPVVKSKFGFHIIQMISRSGDEAVVRHILRIPPVTEDEIKEAKDKLDSVRKEIKSGMLSFGAAVNRYSDDDNSKFSAGAFAARDGSTLLAIDQFDKDMINAIKNLKAGDISQPQVIVDERNRKEVRLVYLKRRTDPHRENLADDYNRVAKRALEEKKNTVLEKWFKEHIPTYYVTIDKDYVGCSGLDEWRKAADRAGKARN